jgi:hypothetical protein
VESFIILAVVAGLSAVVVWWAIGQPGGRPKPKEPRRAQKSKEPRRVQTKAAEEGVKTEGFVLLPSETPLPADDRPPSALSVARLVLTIAVFAVLGVGVLTVLGFLVKSQLDQYFGGL